MHTLIKSIIALLFLFSGCSTAQIDYKHQTLQLSIDNALIAKSRAKKLYENRLRLAHINIYQVVYLLQNSNIVTYEEAYVEPYYRFARSIDMLVHIIFDKYHSKFIDRIGNIYFYQLSTKEKTLYLLVQNRNKKKLEFLYGTNRAGFEDVLQKIKQAYKNSDSHTQKQKTTYLSPIYINIYAADYIQSSWSYKNSIFSELVKREGGPMKVYK